ncbi:hypothetical protein V5O48_006926 [Marasmius crinis-equi]|uniref:G-patch domain-containing protein n=1 Tax=Marasmius crinis-equi TaxID=585013 RepID=A0ABR3FI22_9AGAR
MSASTIARWNAIPLARPEPSPGSPGLKRQRDEDDDDDISIASRTPSPPPDRMEVDEDISKYDEYVRGPAREVITVETRIKSTNKGFALLANMGWSEGQPLGLSGDGRVDPIPFQMKSDSTGIGKSSQDARMIESTVSQRREMDSERQQKESEEQRQAREDAVARRTALASEISDTLKAFYCSLCDKQFQNVAQYDEHTNSYAHHHKARFRDMQASARMKPQEEIDKRKEKERKREERELRKMAAASGIRMAKQPTNPGPAMLSNDPAPVERPSGSTGGWASVSTSTNTSSGSNSGFKKSGWATVGATATVNSAVDVPPPPPSSHGPPPPPPPSNLPQPPPISEPPQSSFVTTGWTANTDPPSLATPLNPPSNAQPPPPSLPAVGAPSAPEVKYQAKRTGWQQFQKNNKRR